jgi:hypothetical protein
MITDGQITGAPASDAIAFVFEDRVFAGIRKLQVDDLFIKLNGEFVVDVDGRAVDAEFTRAELPSGDRPAGSPYGIQGGLFQSWFNPSQD